MTNPLQRLLKLQGKGPLALQRHIDRAALAVAKGIFQSDLLVRVQAPNLSRQFVLEVGFRAENWPPAGHLRHEGIDFDQGMAPGVNSRDI